MRVSVREAETGLHSVLVVDGVGPGGHSASFRLEPGGQRVEVVWDGDGVERRVDGVFVHVLAVVDGSAEIRLPVVPLDAEPEPEPEPEPRLDDWTLSAEDAEALAAAIAALYGHSTLEEEQA